MQCSEFLFVCMTVYLYLSLSCSVCMIAPLSVSVYLGTVMMYFPGLSVCICSWTHLSIFSCSRFSSFLPMCLELEISHMDWQQSIMGLLNLGADLYVSLQRQWRGGGEPCSALSDLCLKVCRVRSAALRFCRTLVHCKSKSYICHLQVHSSIMVNITVIRIDLQRSWCFCLWH